MANNGFHVARVKSGGWYQALCPGGFASAETGIMVAGCVVETDSNTRRVTKIVSLAPPTKLPTDRVIMVFNEREGKHEIEERPFDWYDDRHSSLCDGLDSALQVGLIVEVPEHQVRERYPETWAHRKERDVFDGEGLLRKSVTMDDLRAQFFAAELSNKRAAEAKEASSEADAALTRSQSAK